MLLDVVRTDELDELLGLISTTEARVAVLRARKEVRELITYIESGAVTEQTIERYVADLLRDFERGVRFSRDSSMAAIAVALEMRPTPFARKFLEGLANVGVAELSMSSGIAQVCMANRDRYLISNVSKLAELSAPLDRPIAPRWSDAPFKINAENKVSSTAEAA